MCLWWTKLIRNLFLPKNKTKKTNGFSIETFKMETFDLIRYLGLFPKTAAAEFLQLNDIMMKLLF